MTKHHPALLLSFSLLFACQDADDASEPLAFDEAVGERIPLDAAQRWIARHARTPSPTTVDALPHRLTAPQLASMTSAVPDRIGVVLHHALDDEGSHHVLVTAIGDEAGPLDSPVVLDANTNAPIDERTARAWAAHYEDANPGQIRYHFFGRDVFEEIMTDPAFAYLDVTPAVDDDGRPQLVLMTWSDEGESGDVRPRSHGMEPAAYDQGRTCPNYCPTE